MSDAVYNSLREVPFIEPTNPGLIPTYPQNASTCLQLEIRRDFEENSHVFNQFNNTDKALKQLLISAADDMLIKAYKNPISGYSNISSKKLLNHHYKRYGQLTPQDLKDNDNNLHQPYDATAPIENLFEQIKLAKDIAMTAGSPCNEVQILNAAYNLVFNTFYRGPQR